MGRDLSALFSPKSVAVVGASRSQKKVGAIVLKNIIDSGFTGPLYPVNPNAELINNLKCYPDVESLPEIPDLAVVAIPSQLVPEVVRGIGEKGIKNVVVFAAGFKEIGPEGEKLESELTDIAKSYELNLLGPNCLGFVNNLCPINVTFGQVVSQPGNLRFISQSGALAASLFDWCKATKLGFSDFVTLGNKAVLSENDVLRFWLDHPQNQAGNQEGLSTVFPIGLYLESITDGAEFLSLTSRISQKDPIFILKPGKSQAAAKAMQSHTGAIASEDTVLAAALSQAGAIRCSESEDFFDMARAFAWENAQAGPNVAVISNAGGPAVLSADSISEEGLQLAEFNPETHQKLAEHLPRTASFLNPVDVLGDALADRYSEAIEIVLQEKEVDALIVILTPQIMTQIEKTAQLIGTLSKRYSQPILCSFIGGASATKGEKVLNEYKIPSFSYPERATKALATMWRWRVWREKETSLTPATTLPFQLNLDRAHQILEVAARQNRKNLDNLEANDLILAAGISAPPSQEVADPSQAKLFADSYGWPVVLKLSSPGLLHKTEIGGVITQIFDDRQLDIAWEKLEQKMKQLEPEILKAVKVQMQKEIVGGKEVIVGVKRDSTFGPVLLFGAGGELAELISDRNLRLLPFGLEGARDLVGRSKISRILTGYRGEPAYNLEKLYEAMVRLGQLAEALPEVAEIEINPVVVTLNGAWAVDTKVILREGESRPARVPKFKTATAISHTVLASKFHYFVFEPETPITYLPGQYIAVKVAEQRINDYSIVGSLDTNRFAVLVDVSPGGRGSKFFEGLRQGDKILFLGPFGTFTLKSDDGAEHLLFLGTGSGCSPLKCILEAALKEKNYKLPITLYFGLRYESDVFWKDYFQELALKYPNFHFNLSLSKPGEAWNGLRGHITSFIDKDFPDASKAAVYLCGNKQMIEEATEILLSHGCPNERIYTEKYY